ncbi:hypothetical protein PIROE2DRAFT_8845 [Piromyces sp. E2]|nr:hypothetical protein PIROE2DRAFT_8845 [Piromyces sp. E2]|eukprot:OUM64373.1 hypothetical protein PIROE2DRAFT_8845 [Piromyces sp. E2]
MQEISTQNSAYFAKQEKFRKLAMEIKKSLDAKEYIKIEAYRYLLSAKVLDQLNEFTIQPNYECLCRSLAKYAKTTQQMKLLWSTILLKVNGQLNMITTTYVSKVWKELCTDSKYSHICHFEDDIMNKVDIYFKNHSKQLRKRQINQYSYNYTISQYSSIEEEDSIINSIFNLTNENSDSTFESLNYCNIYSLPF